MGFRGFGFSAAGLNYDNPEAKPHPNPLRSLFVQPAAALRGARTLNPMQGLRFRVEGFGFGVFLVWLGLLRVEG